MCQINPIPDNLHLYNEEYACPICGTLSPIKGSSHCLCHIEESGGYKSNWINNSLIKRVEKLEKELLELREELESTKRNKD